MFEALTLMSAEQFAQNADVAAQSIDVGGVSGILSHHQPLSGPGNDCVYVEGIEFCPPLI